MHRAVSVPLVSGVRMRLRTYARAPMPLGLVALTLSVAAIVSAVLMLASLGQRPLWFDETVSVEAARLSTPSLAHYVATIESNMSLYHVLLHLWLGLGSGDGFARALSVVFGLMTLPVLFALARRLFDVRTAAIAVVLLAANVNFVGHAREARGYSLAVLLVTVSSLFLVRAVQDGGRREWLLFGVVGVFAVYAHMLAALAIAAQLGSVVILRRRIPMQPLVWTAAVMTLLLAPLATALALHPQRRQIDWITEPRPRQLPGLFVWFTESWTLSALFAAAGLLALGAAVTEWRRDRTGLRIWRYVLIVAWLVVPPVAAFVISFAQPVYLYRYFLVCLPALVILVAAGFARLDRSWIVVTVTVIAVALSVRTTAECTPGCVIGDDDWRSAAAYVNAHLRPGDGVIFDPAALRTPFAHYLPPSQRPQLVYPANWPLKGGSAEGAATLPAALAAARSRSRIWVVSWWLPVGNVPERLARDRGGPTVRDFAGNVRLRLYGASSS
jgi:mannosyltransferase